MELTQLVSLMRGAVFQILMLVAPIVATALTVGLVIAIFQAVTQIQEATLSFAPKLFAILLVLAFLGGWMFSSLRGYTINLFEMIPTLK